MQTIEEKLTHITAHYPDGLRPLLRANWKRLLWQVEQVVETVPKGGVVMDLGSGVVPFMAVCQELGYNTIMVDDFGDNFYENKDVHKLLDRFRDSGVQVVHGDIFDGNFSSQFETIDMIVSHDSMEHWHNSPKRLFHDLWQKLTPTGLIWIGVPNCVNLRKRITTPFGYNKWSQMSDWYEPSVFRGHVREPDVGDLRYIAKDLGASRVEIKGRNWIGTRHANPLLRTATRLADNVLRVRPSLCSDIYLYAWK